MQNCVLFQLADIFPKSKMAAVSHIGFVPTFKNHQICIEMTRRTHSDRFWSSMIACNVSAKGFVFNQSITGSHLENVEMANLAYQRESPSPNEQFLPVKQWLRDFVYVLLGLFRNQRWPPSAILDLVSYPKMIFLTSKWPNDDILCIFWPITCPMKPVLSDLWLINQSLAAILKT